MGITKIDNLEQYEAKLGKFEENVKKLYDAGSKTVLTKNTVGDRETFYMHVMRFYLARIARATFEKYKLGLGIYSMQGYERRNKESKNTFCRFNNNRGNVVLPNLRRLWDIFHFSINAY